MNENSDLDRVIPRPLSINPSPASPSPRRHLAAILGRIVFACDARPVEAPTLPSDLPELSALPRAAECLRYFLLEVEYALSPGGEMRGVVKLALRTTLVLGLLLLCLGVLLGGVAVVALILEVIAGQVEAILWHVLTCALLVVAILLVGACFLGLAWGMLRVKRHRP